MKFLILVLMFFIIGALLILANNNLPLYNQENLELFFQLYGDWINQIYVNTQALITEIIRFGWLP
jgi:hypothetical protein